MKEKDKIDALAEMVGASSTLVVGLSGLVYGLLPEEEGYKVEVLLESHNDALESLFKDMKKGENK